MFTVGPVYMRCCLCMVECALYEILTACYCGMCCVYKASSCVVLQIGHWPSLMLVSR